MSRRIAFVFSGQRLVSSDFLTPFVNQKDTLLSKVNCPKLRQKVASVFALYSQNCIETQTVKHQQTDNLQFAIFLRDAILFEKLTKHEFYKNNINSPNKVFFGNSIGEITALVCSGFLSLNSGLGVIESRGRLMQEFFESSPEFGMAMALIKLKKHEEKHFWDQLLSGFKCEVSIHLSDTDKIVSGSFDELVKVTIH